MHESLWRLLRGSRLTAVCAPAGANHHRGARPGSAAGVDVAACRAAFEQAELRRMVEGWGLSRAGAAAVCAARPPAAAEDAAARLLGAPMVVTATPVPPPPAAPSLPLSLRPGVAPWRGISIFSRFVPPSQN